MEPAKFERGLAAGVLGAGITLIGDLLLGANPAMEEATGSVMVDMFQDAARNSDLRMVAGGMLGAVGILLTGVAYFQVYQLLKGGKGVMPRIYWLSSLLYMGLAGAGTHLSCAAIPMLYKWIAESDPALAVTVTEKYAACFMMPPTVLFGVPLLAALVYQAAAVGTGKTAYPRRAALYNMMFGAAAAYALAAVVGNNTVGNGIGTGAISIGHIWMFGMLLAKRPDQCRSHAEKEERKWKSKRCKGRNAFY